MDSVVVVALITSGSGIVCTLIAAIASAVLLPSRKLAASEADNAVLRGELAAKTAQLDQKDTDLNQLRQQLSINRGDRDAT